MKFQTLSVLAGTEVCSAECPFCIARMTGFNGVGKKVEPINVRNLQKAYRLAYRNEVDTLIITGKGEPTIYPEHITCYLKEAHYNGFDFPFIELQTNGIQIHDGHVGPETLKMWYELGMTCLLVSVCHYNPAYNKNIYTPRRKRGYIDLAKVAEIARNAGIDVRLCCVGLDGGIDNPTDLHKLLKYAKEIGVSQLTWRPVNVPDKSEDPKVLKWTEKFFIKRNQQDAIQNWVERHGVLLRKLAHNAVVYDVAGQNLCLTGCLTQMPEEEIGRQLIYYADGRLYTDWECRGSILLGAVPPGTVVADMESVAVAFAELAGVDTSQVIELTERAAEIAQQQRRKRDASGDE